MFSRRERLPRVQFSTTLKAGERISSPHFLLVFSEENRGYAVVIPKKIIRLSSVRHHLKRQILEILRAFPLPPSLIVFPRYSGNSVNYQDIKKELGDLLLKIHN